MYKGMEWRLGALNSSWGFLTMHNRSIIQAPVSLKVAEHGRINYQQRGKHLIWEAHHEDNYLEGHSCDVNVSR
jgi:hypothetical protein